MKYKVTISLFVEAKNPRHAAHIAEGRIATIDPDDRPGVYVAEEYSIDGEWPKAYRVDLRIPKACERVA